MSEDMHAEDREVVKLALSAATGFWNDKVSGDAVDQAESALLSRFAALRAERDALVKRVRELEEAVAIERERRIVTGGTMAEHIADVRAAFSEGAQCAGLSEDGALEMWQHSAALGNLRDTGAFEQALAGRKGDA